MEIEGALLTRSFAGGRSMGGNFFSGLGRLLLGLIVGLAVVGDAVVPGAVD